MDTGTLIGLVVGLLGLGLGLAVPIAMWRGTFSRWIAIHPDADSASPCAVDSLRTRLLALNRVDLPFQ